jgi:hypothetical protein
MNQLINYIMKKTTSIALIAITMLAVACSKDQSAVNKLDGNWSATKAVMTESGFGFAIDLIMFGGSVTFDFDGCKLKNDEWCTATSTLTFDGDSETETMIYRVSGDGTVLESKSSDTSAVINTISILELNRNNCVLKQVDGTVTLDLTLKKND